MAKVRISNRFIFPRIKGKSFVGSVSMTKQSFLKESDINTVIRRYKKTGVLGDPLVSGSRQAIFGDFSSGTDFKEVLDQTISVRESFMLLNADIRRRFDNDPSKLLDFMADSANIEEARKLGILPPEEVAPGAEPDPASPPADAPADPAPEPA